MLLHLQSIEELERCSERHSGATPVRFLRDNGVLECGASLMLVHSMYVSTADLKLLSPEKHMLGLCPSSAIQFGFPCDYPAWSEAGLKICLVRSSLLALFSPGLEISSAPSLMLYNRSLTMASCSAGDRCRLQQRRDERPAGDALPRGGRRFWRHVVTRNGTLR